MDRPGIIFNLLFFHFQKIIEVRSRKLRIGIVPMEGPETGQKKGSDLFVSSVGLSTETTKSQWSSFGRKKILEFTTPLQKELGSRVFSGFSTFF